MPLFMCTKCGSIDNTATSNYWHTQLRAHDAKQEHKPLCSACDPEIGKWHDRFPRRSAAGYLKDQRGHLYSKEEAEGPFKHLGPFVPVTLPGGTDG